jgi:malate dehydrogenase (oxaloacetate-decarboxylating)
LFPLERGKERMTTVEKADTEKLLAKAYKPAQDAMKLHPFYRGKVEVVPKCAIRDFDDFAIWYTPGVAEPCKDIHEHPERVLEHTNKSNFVAVITDGSRVLGLGNIGPEAGLPVMEGKAILFKYLGGVDAFPLCLGTTDTKEIIRTVKILQPTFGGVNLEDIAKPKCFDILQTLRRECHIPVWHDDQQGTAAVTVAGFVNALKVVEKKRDRVKVVLHGAGASNVTIARLLMAIGVDGSKMLVYDSAGALNRDRTELKEPEPEKWHLCGVTNAEGIDAPFEEGIEGADVLVALSRSGPGVVRKEAISKMAKDAIVFACANPIPEIWPWEAKAAGARIVATGRSDFPNQVNNSLGFPGIFRGTLDVAARTITDEMCIAASLELARCAEDNGLSEEYIIPTMEESEVYPREAVAVGQKAIEQGVARIQLTPERAFETATMKIKRAREEVKMRMAQGFIAVAPKD